MRLFYVLIIAGMVAFTSFQTGSASGKEDAVDSLEETAEIVHKVRALVKQDYPDSVHVLQWTMVVFDRNTFWEVTFVSDGSTLGGAPVFHIDKGSLQLIESFQAQ